MKAWMLALVVTACGGAARDVEHARHARYDAERSVLLTETTEVVRRWYVRFDVDPSGVINTAWQEIPRSKSIDNWYETQTNADHRHVRIFLRFHITISDTRPSAIVVTGHGAMSLGGAPPIELRGDEPRWVRDMADKLQLKIHARLAGFAR